MSQERTQPTLGFSTQCFFHGIAYCADDGSFFVFIQWIVSTLAIRLIISKPQILNTALLVNWLINESPFCLHIFLSVPIIDVIACS